MMALLTLMVAMPSTPLPSPPPPTCLASIRTKKKQNKKNDCKVLSIFRAVCNFVKNQTNNQPRRLNARLLFWFELFVFFFPSPPELLLVVGLSSRFVALTSFVKTNLPWSRGGCLVRKFVSVICLNNPQP